MARIVYHKREDLEQRKRILEWGIKNHQPLEDLEDELDQINYLLGEDRNEQER